MLIYAASALFASKPRIRMMSSMKPWEGYDIRIGPDGLWFFHMAELSLLGGLAFPWLLHLFQIFVSCSYLAQVMRVVLQWQILIRPRRHHLWLILEYFGAGSVDFGACLAPIEVVSFCTFFQFQTPRVNCGAQVPKLKDVRFSRRFFYISQDVSEFCQMRVS